LMITLARAATGPSLSMRMAVILGGSWGTSHLIFLGLARLAENTGTMPILCVAPLGYVLAAGWGTWVWHKGGGSVYHR